MSPCRSYEGKIHYSSLNCPYRIIARYPGQNAQKPTSTRITHSHSLQGSEGTTSALLSVSRLRSRVQKQVRSYKAHAHEASATLAQSSVLSSSSTWTTTPRVWRWGC